MKTQEALQLRNVKSKTFIDKKEYTNYRATVHSDLRIVGRDNYNKFVRDYFSTIGELLLEYEGGVCIPKTMYLFMFRIPDKLTYRLMNIKKFNLHSNNYIYAVSAMFGTNHSHWTIRKRSLLGALRSKLVKNLKSGIKYKAYFNTLRNMHKI